MYFFFFYRPRGRMKAGITSSRYGLYKLGYTFATMKITVVGHDPVPRNKCFLSTNRFLQFDMREVGIARK
jgi:hypothetical protein